MTGTGREHAANQHAIAREALPITGAVARIGHLIHYGDLAKELDRGRDNARAVAHACNLLDSAAP